MNAFEHNLPARLLKWAFRQEENFLTESLAHLLQYLRAREPSIAVKFFLYLTNGIINVDPELINTVIIETQLVTSEGRPDLVLRTRDTIVFIEVKNESDFGHLQIERYLSHLKGTLHSNNGLILLTRYPVPDEQTTKASGHIRWHQLGSKLQQLSDDHQNHLETQFILNQFLGLLYSRGILMTRIQSEMEVGLRSLSSLFLMLSEACSSHDLDYSFEFPKPDWIGIRIKSKTKGIYHIGIEPGSPHLLQFGSWNEIQGLEEINRQGFTPYDKKGRVSAWCEFNFQNDEGRFFTLAPDQQYAELECFLWKSIQSYDQLPIAKIIPW